MEQDREFTIVIFRAARSGPHKGDVTAVFPTEPADQHGHEMTCYAHIGQHSACTKDWYWGTRPATYAEYADLLAELVQIGYAPLQRQRITRQMDDARRAAARG